MRILGIDPGYAIVGFGVLDYDKVMFTPVEYGAIFTEAHTDFNGRLKNIFNDMQYIIERYKPDCMAVEKLYFTKVLAHVDGDVFFPEWQSEFIKESEEQFQADEKNDFPTVFQIWVRKK